MLSVVTPPNNADHSQSDQIFTAILNIPKLEVVDYIQFFPLAMGCLLLWEFCAVFSVASWLRSGNLWPAATSRCSGEFVAAVWFQF